MSFLVLLVVEATGFLCVSYTQLSTLPAMVAMVIAATRTYRALTRYGSTHRNNTRTRYDILLFSMLTVL
jgi:hypothetical protein